LIPLNHGGLEFEFAIEMKNTLRLHECGSLVQALEFRFVKNMARHPGMDWSEVLTRLEGAPEKLWSLSEMERTGGEPDVVGHNVVTEKIVFMDCSPQTPQGRVSVCYDRAGWESRKEARPQNNAIDMAAEMGIQILTEKEYRELQNLGEFDTKTSSWVITPPDVRKLGGAIFCDRRFGRIFTYHNGPQSYFGVRGFRGSVKI
jgi:hypothetical protein